MGKIEYIKNNIIRERLQIVDLEGTVDEVIGELNKLKEKYSGFIELEVEIEYYNYDDGKEYYLYGTRKENEQERTKRLAKEKKKREAAKKRKESRKEKVLEEAKKLGLKVIDE